MRETGGEVKERGDKNNPERRRIIFTLHEGCFAL